MIATSETSHGRAKPLEDEEAPVGCGHCGNLRLFTEEVGHHIDFYCLRCGWRKPVIDPAHTEKWRVRTEEDIAEPPPPVGRPHKTRYNLLGEEK